MSKELYCFAKHVYEEPFKPYYDDYHGHLFVIDHVHPEDIENGTPDDDPFLHVFLKCVTDSNVIVKGYVHLDDIEKVVQND